ncbi:MAG: hypothetical protein KC731_34780 [Myxococcales bacterium]|nr:hypothetical protein [Myxococcales bacterium]
MPRLDPQHAHGLLTALVEEGHLELATARGARALANGMSELIEELADTYPEVGEAFGTALAEWLLDQPEVSEIYIDDDALADFIRPSLEVGGAATSLRHPVEELAAHEGLWEGFCKLELGKLGVRRVRVVFDDADDNGPSGAELTLVGGIQSRIATLWPLLTESFSMAHPSLPDEDELMAGLRELVLHVGGEPERQWSLEAAFDREDEEDDVLFVDVKDWAVVGFSNSDEG